MTDDELKLSKYPNCKNLCHFRAIYRRRAGILMAFLSSAWDICLAEKPDNSISNGKQGTVVI